MGISYNSTIHSTIPVNKPYQQQQHVVTDEGQTYLIISRPMKLLNKADEKPVRQSRQRLCQQPRRSFSKSESRTRLSKKQQKIHVMMGDGE